MAQTMFMPSQHALPMHTPSSPDPTPLRMIAFSVAEAALQSDPNSPSFNSPEQSQLKQVPDVPSVWNDKPNSNGPQVFGRWTKAREADKGNDDRQRLLAVMGRGKERREREKSPLSVARSLPATPPISPTNYNFVMPSNSPLAASIAATPRQDESMFSHRGDIPTPPRLIRERQSVSPPMNAAFSPPRLTITPPSRKAQALYTRSVEPSPTRPMFATSSPVRSTFDGLDRSNPPAEFVPRLSAAELTSRLRVDRPRSTSPVAGKSPIAEQASSTRPHKQLTKLPSLAQIKAKMDATDNMPNNSPRRHSEMNGPFSAATTPIRRSSFADSFSDFGRRDSSRQPRIKIALPSSLPRSESQRSVEFIQTPTDDVCFTSGPRIVLAGSMAERRSTTPPSPTPGMGLNQEKDTQHRLSSFLRQRTSGRLASGGRARPVSMPPLRPGLSVLDLNSSSFDGATIPPPSRSATPSPTRTHFAEKSALNSYLSRNQSSASGYFTPPHKTAMHRADTPEIISPTDSVKSHRSSSVTSIPSISSPTLSVPMITCTPAPVRLLRDGVEQDSDEESSCDDVVLFEGEGSDTSSLSADGQEEETFGAREKVGRMMKEKLGLRRISQ